MGTLGSAAKTPRSGLQSSRESAFAKIEHLVQANYENPDIEAVKVTLACMAAHRLVEYQPAWLMLIAPSGSMKTEILRTLDGLPGVSLVDELTENTMISGKVDDPWRLRQGSPSFLHRMGNEGVLILADFSTILSMDPRKMRTILAQFRRLYDGDYAREFGTADNLEDRRWKGRLTVLAGCTPDIDRHHGAFQSLGERFSRVRLCRAGGVNSGLLAMRQDRSIAIRFKSAVHEFLLPVLSQRQILAPFVPEHMLTNIASLGEFVALARVHVPRDRNSREIDGEVAPEGNTRLPQQLAQVACGWAALMGRSEVSHDDYLLARRVGFDCIPPVRRAVLEGLRKGQKPHTLGLAASTADRALEDLVVVGLVKDEGDRRYSLSAQAHELLLAIDPS